MIAGKGSGTILFNPVSVVHHRNVVLFRDKMEGWRIRKIINPRMPWFYGRAPAPDEIFFSASGRLPKGTFDDVKAVVIFSAQPRIPSCLLIGEAASRGIPVIAVEEVLQMMIEQGYVNEYFLPVDRLFAGAEIERKGFIDFGIPAEAVEAAGCVFGYIKPETFDGSRKRGIIKKLGLNGTKKIAVLSLAYQTPSGETLAVRRKLIETVSRGLPPEYELLIKPHPAEQDTEIEKFVYKYAPEAKVADKFIPIGDILGVADILFNRGNSQVIIDAFNRGIPVAVVPEGRKTFFDGVLDEVIIKDEKDVKRVLDLISSRGFSIYKNVIGLYSQISPEEALKKVSSEIIGYAASGKLFEPEQRQADLSVYWAWMGYAGQSRRLLSSVEGKIDSELYSSLENLNSYRASRADLEMLKKWASRRYRLWLLKSMWIKQLFLTDEQVSDEDAGWLVDYPPRMNREYFVDYACMLLWCLMRAGRTAEYEKLLARIYDEYSYLKCVREIKERGRPGRRVFDAAYWRIRAGCSFRSAARNASFELSVA